MRHSPACAAVLALGGCCLQRSAGLIQRWGFCGARQDRCPRAHQLTGPGTHRSGGGRPLPAAYHQRRLSGFSAAGRAIAHRAGAGRRSSRHARLCGIVLHARLGRSHWPQQAIAQLDAAFAAGAVAVKVWKNIGMEFRDCAGSPGHDRRPEVRSGVRVHSRAAPGADRTSGRAAQLLAAHCTDDRRTTTRNTFASIPSTTCSCTPNCRLTKIRWPRATGCWQRTRN